MSSTHLPDPLYPADIKANPRVFGEGDPPEFYTTCDINAGNRGCPDEKHYHHTAIFNLLKSKQEEKV